MKIKLDIRKTVDENATAYFEQAKKEKKKIEGAKKIISEYKKKLEHAQAEKEEKKQVVPKRTRKQDWFEKFRWFISSDGFVVIGGRDATTNEIVIKKHAQPGDIVFHTDMAGSPFVVIKTENKGFIPETTLIEAAEFTAAFSRGWKNGMATLPVFSCAPEQVSKTPNPGESLGKGAFVIRGELKYYSPKMEYAVGAYDGTVMGGPVSAVKKNCEKMIILGQGDSKISDVAKALRKALGGELDEIMRAIPANCRIKKN